MCINDCNCPLLVFVIGIIEVGSFNTFSINVMDHSGYIQDLNYNNWVCYTTK